MGFDSIKPTKQVFQKVEEQSQHRVVITSYSKGEKAMHREVFFGTLLGVASATLMLVLFFTFAGNNLHANKDNKAVNLPNNNLPTSFKAISSYSNLKQIGKLDPAEVEAEIRAVITKIGTYNDVYLKAEKKYHVPRQILAAVHFVESHQSGDNQRRSSAGAMGPMQFMPSTFDAYAQDGDGDGKKMITDVHDAIFTAAKLLAANGASDGRVAAALYNYNHSYEYVMKVLEVAKEFGYTHK